MNEGCGTVGPDVVSTRPTRSLHVPDRRARCGWSRCRCHRARWPRRWVLVFQAAMLLVAATGVVAARLTVARRRSGRDGVVRLGVAPPYHRPFADRTQPPPFATAGGTAGASGRSREGWMYNNAGRDAIELSLRSGRVFRIGTDQPDELLEALRRGHASPCEWIRWRGPGRRDSSHRGCVAGRAAGDRRTAGARGRTPLDFGPVRRCARIGRWRRDRRRAPRRAADDHAARDPPNGAGCRGRGGDLRACSSRPSVHNRRWPPSWPSPSPSPAE